jgi:hypothetical protein
MNTSNLTSQERKVYGTNLINTLSIEAVKKISPQLQPFLNKKVVTTKGDKTKAFNIELLTVPFVAESGQSYRSYLKFEYGRLTLFNDVTVKDKEYEGGGYGVSYYKKEIDLGYVTNGVLTEINTFDKVCLYEGLTLKYDAKEQTEIKRKIEQLETEINLLKSKLC